MERKTQLIKTAKYGISSGAIGLALTQIIVFAFPHLKEISDPIVTLLTIAVNIGLVYSGVISETE